MAFRGGCLHSIFIRTYFKIEPVGIDCGNIEIKESNNEYQDYTLKHSDSAAEYILFYNHKTSEFALCDTTMIQINSDKRSIKHNQIKRLAGLITTDLDTIKKAVEIVIADPKYLNWK